MVRLGVWLVAINGSARAPARSTVCDYLQESLFRAVTYQLDCRHPVPGRLLYDPPPSGEQMADRRAPPFRHPGCSRYTRHGDCLGRTLDALASDRRARSAAVSRGSTRPADDRYPQAAWDQNRPRRLPYHPARGLVHGCRGPSPIDELESSRLTSWKAEEDVDGIWRNARSIRVLQ